MFVKLGDNGKDKDGGEFGPRTPIELRETRRAGVSLDVKVPRSQAFWMALPLAVAVMLTIVSPAMLGARIFSFATGVAALAAFIWSVLFESHWLDRITLPALVGTVGWCFWKFAAGLGWTVPEAWQPWPSLLSIFGLVFWWTLTGALWLAFVQELALRSPFLEKSLSETIADLVIWRIKKPRPRPDRPLFVSKPVNGEVELNQYKLPPVTDLTDLELFLLLVQRQETLSRDTLTKCTLDSGRHLTKSSWQRAIADLVEAGYVENGSSGYCWSPGASAEVALKQFSRPSIGEEYV